MSELLSSLFTKEWSWANRSCCSLKRSYVSNYLAIRANLLEKILYYYSFSLLFPFFMDKSESLFTKEQPCMSQSLPSLITKEQLWVIRSRRSLQKSDRSESLFFRANRSFDPLLFCFLLFCSWKTSYSLENPKSKFPKLESKLCAAWAVGRYR